MLLQCHGFASSSCKKTFSNINIFIETEATKKAKECLHEAGQRLHNLTVEIYLEDVLAMYRKESVVHSENINVK